MASRYEAEDLRCDVEVGFASELRSGASREIKIASLITSLLVIRDRVLNMLLQRITFACVSTQ